LKLISMRIVRLQIKNFRGIRSADIHFGQTSVLIGPNNVGKTTIVEALALLLGRDRLVRDMTEHDFYGGDPQVTDRVRVVVTLDGFPKNDIKYSPTVVWTGSGHRQVARPNDRQAAPIGCRRKSALCSGRR
jgi:putative ATP-dependent endonuclease of the OLD family